MRLVAAVAAVILLSCCGSAPAASHLNPSPSPRGPVNYANCTLPILSVGSAGWVVGFVNTGTGRFTPDLAATAANKNQSYDPVVRRWVDAPADAVSPDGKSYAYVATNPSSGVARLHVRDIESGQDRVIWTLPEAGTVEAWKANGIRIFWNRFAWSYWLVDPNTGAVATNPGSGSYPYRALPGDPPGGGFQTSGFTLAGEKIYSFEGADAAGTVDWTFYEDGSGQRVYIEKRTHGDPSGFNAGRDLADSTGVWFADFYQNSFVWHWQVGEAPIKVPVAGLTVGGVKDILGPCF